MADDRKHPNRVPVYLTDREFIDAGKAAMALDKPLAEYLRFVLRGSMYGTMGISDRSSNQNSSADECRSE